MATNRRVLLKSRPAGEPTHDNWPPAWNPDRAAPLRADLARILAAALAFAKDA